MPFRSYKKVGGLHHFRIGRIGGSFYLSRKPVDSSNPHAFRENAAIGIVGAFLAWSAVGIGYAAAPFIFGG